MYNIRSGGIRWQIPDFIPECNSYVRIFQRILCRSFNDEWLSDMELKDSIENDKKGQIRCKVDYNEISFVV